MASLATVSVVSHQQSLSHLEEGSWWEIQLLHNKASNICEVCSCLLCDCIWLKQNYVLMQSNCGSLVQADERPPQAKWLQAGKLPESGMGEYLGLRMEYPGRYSSPLKTLQTSASSWRPSWSLSRVSRDCWIYLRMRRRNIFSGALVLDQPAPLKIIHQLHKGNPIQLDALKALIEPAIKPKNWGFVVKSIHCLYFVRM